MTKQEYINRVLLIMNEAGLYDKDGTSFIGADSAQVDRYIEGSFVDAWRRCAGVMPKAWFKNATFRNQPTKTNLPDGTGFIVLPDDFYLLVSLKMQGWSKSVLDAYIENERVASIQSNEYTRGSQLRPVAVISSVSAIDYITVTEIKYWQAGTPANPEVGEVWYDSTSKDITSYQGLIIGWAPSLTAVGDIFIFNDNYFEATDIEDGEVELTAYDPYNDIKQALYYYSLKKGLASHAIENALYIPVAEPLSSLDNTDTVELDHRIVEPMAYLNASSVFTIFEKHDIAKALEQRVVEMFPAFKSVKGNNVTFKQ